MLFAFTSRGFYIIDCQDSPNIIFDFAHHRFLHETGLERHFSTASQFSYDNACVCSNNKPLDWFFSTLCLRFFSLHHKPFSQRNWHHVCTWKEYNLLFHR